MNTATSETCRSILGQAEAVHHETLVAFAVKVLLTMLGAVGVESTNGPDVPIRIAFR